MADMTAEKKGADAKSGIGALLGKRLRENGMLLALVAIVAFFTIMLQLNGKDFLNPATSPTCSCRTAM